ncbi:halo transducer protein [Halorubrum pallidum]|uniref:Halo transducer protein n=1 Tax=Halorubrum pallidum TaxID=1526114 RepID=A0ABD5T3X6_9EURY
MTEVKSDDERADLDGLSVGRAADIIADDEERVSEMRETLAILAQDGTIRRSAVDDAVANASMVVTTAETRVELAAGKLDSARKTAVPVSDLDLVSARITSFEERLHAIEDRADTLGEAIQEILSMKTDGDLYEIARRIRRVTNAATETQRAADDLQLELESFEGWLTNADRRADELVDDVEAVAESINELDTVAEALAGADGDSESEKAQTWIAAMIRHRVVSLMIVDLRAESAALRRWAERESSRPPSAIEPRLDEIETSHEAVGERLTAHANPKWTAQYGDQLTALDEALDSMEPPVAWDEVEAITTEHRSEGT